MLNLRLFILVGLFLLGVSVLQANPINTAEEFSETWENLAADSGGGAAPTTGAPENGWSTSYNAYIRAGNIGGTGDRIYESRESNDCSIYRSDLIVAPSAAGKFYFEYDYKLSYTADNYNYSMAAGQNGINTTYPLSVNNPKVQLWVYANDTTGALYNQADDGNTYLCDIESGTAYHIAHVIDINTDTHLVTVTNNDTQEIVYQSASGLDMYGDWTNTTIDSLAFRKGWDNNTGGVTYIDNILVTSVPEPMTMGLLLCGAAMVSIRRRK